MKLSSKLKVKTEKIQVTLRSMMRQAASQLITRLSLDPRVSMSQIYPANLTETDSEVQLSRSLIELRLEKEEKMRS